MRYDVLVVGCGPGGATAAYTLSREGAKVLIVDIKRAPGVPVQCAEFVPIQLRHRFPEFFPDEVVSQAVKDMVHFTPWGELVRMGSEGYVLYRDRFDRNIVELALQHGAELRLRTQFLGFEDGNVWLEHIDGRERYSVKADIIIGADGPHSKTAKLTGEHTRMFLTTAQFTLPLKHKLHDLLIYFREYIPGGYGWVFPKGELANVGVGIDPDYPINVMESLKRFVDELLSEGLVEYRILGRTGGWIPAEGVKKPIRGKVLLVGDAGGFCHPITGGGIANAVYTGAMAGEAVLEGSIEDYEEEALEVFGSSLNRAAGKRIKYMKSWDNLRFIIPKTWIAFEEYWKED
ncbi:geranylgeranyl reductase family protein [Hydrogenivirga caldilitoris]|uniref:Geranylgeranyl reductase family protein n=1 Tax=Hydrogenivirga caldilitoris TaxID=246264 RepID=A0A497XS22_9AQUI|nr:NAD(P)/FAD-dependent oxidoreductase [Hydrogenivirga caldilitoris]RLJ69932.1 geranylgeranyl reductase family protein [Hydrogenivirga caldilitoris]